MENHITTEVTHYKDKIYAWDVVNEPFNDDGSYRNDVFYNAFGGGEQYIADAITTAHTADPNAKLYINDYNIEATDAKSNAMYTLAQQLLAAHVPLSGIGFESHFIVGQIPNTLASNMQRFTALGLDVAITELDDRMPTPASNSNLQQQATDDTNIVKTCLNNPHCPGITQWNISDADSWVPGTFPGQGAATMFDNNYQPKPAYNAVITALAAGGVPPSSPPPSSPPPTYPNLAASFNNVGITADNNTAPGNFDGNNASFSETALTNAHAAPGATVSSSGVTFTFPNVTAGSNDNTVAEGQTITQSGTGTLGFLLSSSYGPASGTGTLTYTDGSTQNYTLSTADWWSTTPAAGSALAISSAYQNRQGNTTATQTGNIFSQTVALTSGKTVASVQLPTGGALASGTPALHIFALATTGSSTGPNTVTVTSPGNQTGTAGTAITAIQIHGTDSAAGQTLTYTATGLPTGLSISSSGLISGTPTAAGTSNVTVTATDATGASGSATFMWTIATATGNTVTVANPGAQTTVAGTAITGIQIQATDSATGQTLAYSATGLPAGLSISSSGLISGSPTTAGTSNVTITATDSTGASGSATFSWTVTAGTGGVCHVDYAKTSEWAGGFTANVVITNTGTAAISGWTLTFTFPGDQTVTNAWNATTTQTGEAVTATNLSYNTTIAPGANTSFGFQGTWTSNDTNPSAFALNGTPCN
jgi:endo-1,4-beta-xylanase